MRWEAVIGNEGATRVVGDFPTLSSACIDAD
jgi:hypothetical protein